MNQPLSRVDKAKLRFMRSLTSVLLVTMLVLVVINRHSYTRASLALYLAAAVMFAGSSWIRSLVLHPAYGSALGFLGWTVISIESWMRHSRIASFYTCFSCLLGFVFAGILWMSRRSAQDDDPDSLEYPPA